MSIGQGRGGGAAWVMTMKAYWEGNNTSLTCADCREWLPTLPEASVDCCVTDPPYELNFMNAAWDRRGVAFDPETWRAVLRVLKPGAALLAFGGTRTFHRMVCAIEDAGFEIRDTITWVHAQGFPKSLDIGKAIDKAAGAEREVTGKGRGGKTAISDLSGKVSGYRPNTYRAEDGSFPLTAPATPEAQKWDGWGTALKPAVELICMARKPLSEPNVAANVLKHGCGGLNVDRCRISSSPTANLEVWEPEENRCGLCVEAAASTAKREPPATRGSTVQSPAGPTTNGKGRPPLDATNKPDTGCSNGPCPAEPRTGLFDDANSSTGMFGNATTEPSQTATSSTTSTATRKTTGSRTCISCGEPFIPASTAGTPRSIPTEPQGQTTRENGGAPTLNTGPSTPHGNEHGGPGSGRYPSNFCMTHAPGCELRGERRVRGISGGTGGDFGKNGIYGDGTRKVETAKYADPDGLETVADWRCVEGCPVAELDRQAGVRTSGTVKAGLPRSNGSQEYGFSKHLPNDGSTGPASRFFFCSKSPTNERSLLCRICNAVYPAKDREAHRHGKDDWAHVTQHPTQKPVDLMRWLLRLACPPGGVCVDPFCGTATTGEAARVEGMPFLGCDQSEDYLRIGAERLGRLAQGTLALL